MREASRELAGIARDERIARLRGERDGDLRFRRLAEKATDAIFVLRFDPDPRIVYLNPAVEQLTGHPRQALLDDPDLFAGMFGDGDRDRLQAALETDSEASMELQLRDRDGCLRWVSVSTTVLTDDTGKVELVQGIARDIDQRKRAELALQASLDQERAAAERLARLNQMTSTFLTAISHELRTPLTSVLGFADLLADHRPELSDEQQEQMLERLRANAYRLRRLLEDVLDVDRLTCGELAPKTRPVRLDVLVEQVVQETGHDADRFVVTVPPLEVTCDPLHLERIVANLFGNAVRHTPPGTPVEVCATADDDVAVLTVDDHGPGVPDHLKRQVFAPFVHGPEAADSPSPGTGLGLTLARELARLNGGDVEVADRPGGGARLLVTLPR